MIYKWTICISEQRSWTFADHRGLREERGHFQAQEPCELRFHHPVPCRDTSCWKGAHYILLLFCEENQVLEPLSIPLSCRPSTVVWQHEVSSRVLCAGRQTRHRCKEAVVKEHASSFKIETYSRQLHCSWSHHHSTCGPIYSKRTVQ